MVFVIAFVCRLFTRFSSHSNVEILCWQQQPLCIVTMHINGSKRKPFESHPTQTFRFICNFSSNSLSACAFGDAAKWTNTVATIASELQPNQHHSNRKETVEFRMPFGHCEIRLKLNYCLDKIRTDHRPEIYCYSYRFVFIWVMKLRAYRLVECIEMLLPQTTLQSAFSQRSSSVYTN